jgi:hypothetical protein
MIDARFLGGLLFRTWPRFHELLDIWSRMKSRLKSKKSSLETRRKWLPWDESAEIMWHPMQQRIDGATSNGLPPISRPDGIPDSLIVFWIDNTCLIKAALSDLNFHSLLHCDGRISDRLSHQKVKTHLHIIKVENHKQRSVMKFLLFQIGVLGEAAVSLATVKG